MEPRPDRSLWLLASGVCLMAVLAAAVRPPKGVKPGAGDGPVPELPAGTFPPEGREVVVRSAGGGELLVSTDPSGPLHRAGSDMARFIPAPDERRTERLVSVPTAMHWQHPAPGQPSAWVLRVAEEDDAGRTGPERLYTALFVDHGALPVVSIVVDEAALFDADTGIYVVGNAIMHPDPEMTKLQMQDARWWKYPGNFHFRGKEWQREARMQFIGTDGKEVFQGPVGLRINGQMTRGFPQHALRLVFEEPLGVGLFPGGEGVGARAMVLRSGGNDHGKAMMRDAVVHAMCSGLGFDVSLATTCAVYINGAYWGLHHLRQRIDEKELARRHGVPAKQVGIVELRMKKPLGEEADVAAFKELVKLAKAWDGKDTAVLRAIGARLDLERFLTYMAATMIVGNKDWPSDNVKFWRYTGPVGAGMPRDGRWYPIMGDSDLGLGANAPSNAGLLAQVRAEGSPIPDLFRGLMRHAALKDRFIALARALAQGPLAEDALAEVDAFAARMAPEMARHTARWREPADTGAWQAEVQAVRTYIRERAGHVLHELEDL